MTCYDIVPQQFILCIRVRATVLGDGPSPLCYTAIASYECRVWSAGGDPGYEPL